MNGNGRSRQQHASVSDYALFSDFVRVGTFPQCIRVLFSAWQLDVGTTLSPKVMRSLDVHIWDYYASRGKLTRVLWLFLVA